MPLTSLSVKKIKYLGHTIGGGEHGPDEDKALAIKRLIRPTTKKVVRSVLGLMGFYCAYIPNYAQISTPLTELTKKNKPNKVSWGEAEQSTFDKLKELLCKVTSLATPYANLPFQVHCDTSDYDFGCCLTHQDTDGVYMPIAFASQKFTAKQKNWASIEKEAWAVLYGLNKFDRWIYGAKVEIISDHNPLKYLNQMTPKSPKHWRYRDGITPSLTGLVYSIGVQAHCLDFSLGATSPDVATLSPSSGSYTFKENLDSVGDENEDLLGTEKKEGTSFWKFSYYQSFFDVDTDQVVQRIVWSMIPLPGRATFLDRQIRPKPDLYGPFWIAATLVFSTAICANIANYLRTEGQSAHTWSYDFHKVSLSATAIYSYTFLLPIILWGLMWYRQSSNRYSLLEILCVYGYSLAIYVPISVLWVIQVAWFQWILVIIGATLSGAVLLQTFWPIFRDDNKKIAAVVLCLILLFHTLLAVGFVTYFFSPPNSSKLLIATTPNIPTSGTINVSEKHPKHSRVPTQPTLETKLKSLSQVLEQEHTQHGISDKEKLIIDQIAEINDEIGTNKSNSEVTIFTTQQSNLVTTIGINKI
ncbi:protein YIPF1 [Trichonephila clavata]|uniref:RNA-directed DNA polymerase n=1 Tax=Trichonephila clavata TaxID=2740835 RepID=A0A8X6F1I3_TRICU|nr:protein YIPF1 [Trichonephila clavata]